MMDAAEGMMRSSMKEIMKRVIGGGVGGWRYSLIGNDFFTFSSKTTLPLWKYFRNDGRRKISNIFL